MGDVLCHYAIMIKVSPETKTFNIKQLKQKGNMIKLKTTKTTLFAILTGIFTACLVVSNILAGRIFDLGILGLTLAGGFFLFPITYIVNDVMAEVYGYQKFRRVIWLGFFLNLIFVAVYTLINVLPAPVYMQETADAFQVVLAQTPRLLVASLTAYLLGGLANAKVLDLLHIKDKEERFGKRAVISTLVGEGIDSIIFTTIAFLFQMPLEALILMIITNAVLKTLYEVACLPITTKVVKWAKSLPKGSI